MTLLLAAVFSSPDRKAITLAAWAKAAPNDVVATATGELAGTTHQRGYGAPYNNAAEGQKIGPLPTQKLGRRSDSGRQRQRPGDQPAQHGRRDSPTDDGAADMARSRR